MAFQSPLTGPWTASNPTDLGTCPFSVEMAMPPVWNLEGEQVGWPEKKVEISYEVQAAIDRCIEVTDIVINRRIEGQPQI